jgi:hypothetical protein
MKNTLQLQDQYINYCIDVGANFTYLNNSEEIQPITPWTLSVMEADNNRIMDAIQLMMRKIEDMDSRIKILMDGKTDVKTGK